MYLLFFFLQENYVTKNNGAEFRCYKFITETIGYVYLYIKNSYAWNICVYTCVYTLKTYVQNIYTHICICV